ncbi:hypothetical protein MMC30_005229 [Trapelia coarctata]|nr:hypothetical protein [Trapelia coarctata]
MSSSTQNPAPKIVFIIGPPGAGKGTLSGLLVAQYPHIFHLSVGDYMRSCLLSGAFGTSQASAALHLESGALLPTEIILPLLKGKIEGEMGKGWRYFLVDGFPRNIAQAGVFEREIAKPLLVINLYCPYTTARIQLLTRHIPNRAATDTEEIFSRRYREYTNHNPGIVYNYSQNQLKLVNVDSNGPKGVVFREMVGSMREKEAGREFLDGGDGWGKLLENGIWKGKEERDKDGEDKKEKDLGDGGDNYGMVT